VRRERHEQALGTLASSTLDALGDPLGIQPLELGGEPIIDTCTMMSNYTNIFGSLLGVRGPDCLHDGIDQVVCSREIGSCSLQEEQML
jgi:hypothetical protein